MSEQKALPWSGPATAFRCFDCLRAIVWNATPSGKVPLIYCTNCARKRGL